MKNKIAWGILIVLGTFYLTFLTHTFIKYPMALLFAGGFAVIIAAIWWSLITIINN